MSAEPPPALEMRAISKRFGDQLANDGVDLTVRRGEIHGLLGENGAGKSTLMKIAYGLYRADAGEIRIDGQPAEISGPAAALASGVGMVHQDFMLVADMTGAENVALGEVSPRLRGAQLREVSGALASLAARHGLRVDPDVVVEQLGVGERQRLEILKVLYRGARILVMDEPTAVLTPQEWMQLADVLRSLASEGHAVILISHKLDEIARVCDRCTVLRDGRVVATRSLADVDKRELARLMVGRDVDLGRRPDRRAIGGEVLVLRDVVAPADRGAPLRGIDLTVRSGEILGLAGVEGNGQQPLVEVIAGLRTASAGSVRLGGEEPTGPRRFARLGGALVPEDRHRDAIAPELTVADNLLLREFADEPYARAGVLRRGRMLGRARALMDAYDVRAASPATPIARLSGGNQQKAVLARELARRPRLLIAAQPTRGLDVGACEAVYAQLRAFAAGGGAVLLISTELEEIFALADRIAVLFDGRVVGVLDATEASVGAVGLLMAGQEALA